MKRIFTFCMVGALAVGSVLAQEEAAEVEAVEAVDAAAVEAEEVLEATDAATEQAEVVEAEAEEDPAAPFETLLQKVSYAIGMQMAAGIQQQGLEVDPELFAQGFAEQMRGAAQISAAAANESLFAYQKEQLEQRQETLRQLAERNQQAGDAYRAEFAAKEGVVVTDSGLLYEVITEGSGPKPGPNDTVTLNYTGTFVNDAPYREAQNETHAIANMYAGWAEGLQLMSVGSTYRLVVPPELGFGAAGSPPPRPNALPEVGPNATIIYEIELLEVEGLPASAPAP